MSKFFWVFMLFSITAYSENQMRVATFNVSMEATNYRSMTNDELLDPDALKSVLMTQDHSHVQNIAEIIQRTRPDILLLNEFDYIEDVESGVAAFQKNYLSRSQNGSTPINYPYYFVKEVNTGMASPYDLDNDGEITGIGGDAWGFGLYPGHYGMLVLSRFPIVDEDVRTFQTFKWSDMPDALEPIYPVSMQSWYEEEEWTDFRLSSKSVWDIPVNIDGRTVHILASHPTPPVFDGEEDRNGKRNHDEIRFLSDYISNQSYIYDDKGYVGGLDKGQRFIILGDLNASPDGGDSLDAAINQLLQHNQVNSCCFPQDSQQSPVTSSWGLQVDYVLPSKSGLDVIGAGMFLPEPESEFYRLIESRESSSDHRMIWLDLKLKDKN